MGIITFHPVLGFPKTGSEKSRGVNRGILQVDSNEPIVHQPAADALIHSNRKVEPTGDQSILSRLIISDNPESFQQLSSLFHFVKDSVLQRCLRFGTSYYILGDEALLRLFGDLPKVPGGYSSRLKACILHEEGIKQRFLPFILLAHAYDHAVGEDGFASVRSPLLQSLFLSCKRKKRNHQFMSGYGESGAMEYFAESMAFYFYPDEEVRGILKTFDRAMFDYLELLFRC